MPHSPEVAAALEASIEKWKRNTKIKHTLEATIGSQDCPLCHMFWRADCRGCPVREQTGYDGCSGTPYDGANNAYYHSDLAEFHDAARKEVAFLESLRDPPVRSADE